MEANFFKNVNNLNIKGGHFISNNGPNAGQKIIHNQRNTTINDHSRRTTNIGSYENHGYHAESGGQINNYGPQPSIPGAGYDNQPYARNNWSPPSSDDDDNNFNANYHPPPRSQGPYRGPDRSIPRNRDPLGHYPSQSEPRLGSNRPRQAPRANTERPDYPRKDFHHTSPEFQAEYERMSPKMKDYFKSLGFVPGPQHSLNEGMANMRLDRPGPQSFSSSGTPGRPISPGSGQEEQNEDDEEDDYDADNGDLEQHRSSYVHNDNRVITTNVNSNNVNTENIVDSYNDNSTRTDIRKGSAAR